MRLTLLIWAVRQFGPSTWRRRLRQLGWIVGFLGLAWGRAVGNAEHARVRRQQSHVRRRVQAGERLERAERSRRS